MGNATHQGHMHGERETVMLDSIKKKGRSSSLYHEPLTRINPLLPLEETNHLWIHSAQVRIQLGLRLSQGLSKHHTYWEIRKSTKWLHLPFEFHTAKLIKDWLVTLKLHTTSSELKNPQESLTQCVKCLVPAT